MDVSGAGTLIGGGPSRTVVEITDGVDIDMEDVVNVVDIDVVDEKVDVVEVVDSNVDVDVDVDIDVDVASAAVVVATRLPPTLLVFGTAVHFLPSISVVENVDIVTPWRVGDSSRRKFEKSDSLFVDLDEARREKRTEDEGGKMLRLKQYTKRTIGRPGRAHDREKIMK